MIYNLLSKEDRLYYNSLVASCKNGLAKEVSRILKNNDKVDILYHDGVLLRIAANDGGAEVLNIIIDYYIAHIAAEPESDEYLSSIFKLIEKLDNARQLSEKFAPGVIEIFNKYIPEDYKEESDDVSGFEDGDTTIVIEDCVAREGAEGYSSDEFHRRVSDSSDCINLADISSLAGNTQVPPE